MADWLWDSKSYLDLFCNVMFHERGVWEFYVGGKWIKLIYMQAICNFNCSVIF